MSEISEKLERENNKNKEDDIISAAKYLGQVIRSDERLSALEKAKNDYACDPIVLKLMAEYTASEKALMSLCKDEENSELYDKINTRMNEIYDEISSSDAYKKYEAAQNEVNELMSKVNSVITQEVSGSSGCTHDCSSCHGCK